MTRSSNPDMVAARANPNLESRDFLRIGGRNRSTGAIEYANFWNGIGTVTAAVVDVETGEEVEYVFVGAGSLISIDGIAAVCEQSITIGTLTVTLSQIDQNVANQARGYDLHEQRAYIWQGDFDLETKVLASPAESVFAGIVDTCDINEPEAGGTGSIEISLRSHVSEMTRKSTLKRSHASEILRNPDDEFYLDTAVVGKWISYLGQDTPKQISGK